MTVKASLHKPEQKHSRKKWFEICEILTLSMISFTCGVFFCWPSPFIVKIVNDKEHYDISEEEASYFTVISTVGVIILPPFWSPLVARYGRKKFLLFTSVPYIATFIIKAFARSKWVFYFARLLNGIGDSITFTCVIVFIGEIASPEVRGVWGNAVVWQGFLGQFLVNVLGIYCSVQLTSFICVIVPVLFFIIFMFMPESPYFYIAKGKYEDAKISLRKLRRTSDVDQEFTELQAAIEKRTAQAGSWKDLIVNRINRRTLLIAMFLRTSQILSGVFAIGPYIQLIFKKSGTNISAETSTIVYTFLNFILYSLASYGSNKLGRRLSLISSLIATAIIFFLETAYFFVDRYCPNINLESIQWFPLVGLLTFLVFSSYGIGTVPFLMPGELFSNSVKAKGIAIVISLFGLMNFIVNGLFYKLTDITGLGGPFLLFAISNTVSAFITYKIVPETKNKTLEEIQIILNKM